jgi:hypothetical protein
MSGLPEVSSVFDVSAIKHDLKRSLPEAMKWWNGLQKGRQVPRPELPVSFTWFTF